MAEMEDPTVNGERAVDLAGIRQVLLSNSTKHRTAELHDLRNKLTVAHETSGLSPSQTRLLLGLLFATYPLYVDTRSRQAVERCLSTIASLPEAAPELSSFVQEVHEESTKPTIAPANAFVLVRWSSLLLQNAAANPDLWKAIGTKCLLSLTNALNTVFSSGPKRSTIATAVRVSRRAIRSLALSKSSPEALEECITLLSAKAAGPSPKNAITLGIVAGVCKRLPGRDAIIDSRKQDYISFYLRELLGSRVQLPNYVGKALHEFFAAFVTFDDFKKDVVPAVEKAMLRAPEVVLNDLVAPLVVSLPKQFDLSEVLVSNLLKPLLSNIKSSNAVIRDGALHTFKVVAARCEEDKLVEKAAGEILTPLKSNKVAAADQRVFHAQMLSALRPTSTLSMKVQQGLVPVAIKETNDAAASAELHTLGKYLIYALENDVKLESSTTDAFSKGLAEKRLPLRRLWALTFSEIVWSTDVKHLNKESSTSFIDSCAGKLIDIFNEVAANPIPAAQNGQVSVACAVAALCLNQLPSVSGLKTGSIVKKANVTEKALALEPKPSFLLNPRVYTKLALEDDLTWFQRGLMSAFAQLPQGQNAAATSLAWAQAMIYLSVAQSVPAKIRNETLTKLESLYASYALDVSHTIIGGLWQWCEDLELEARDSAAIAAKSGRDELYKIVRAICLDNGALLHPTDKATLEDQMIRLLVPCRPQIIPRASWIELCLRTGTDPGGLAGSASEKCLAQILIVTENPIWKAIPSFQSAAFAAAAELAFVAPDDLTPLIVSQIGRDLDPNQLQDIGPTEAAIYRTPEGTAFIDVLSKQPQAQEISKNAKDYETLKWEEELRAQLAQKKGQTKKLTADEQSKVNAQLARESEVRERVSQIVARLRRGVGIVSGLVTGPPTEAETWFGRSVELLSDIIQAGAGLIIGDTAALGYLQCANRTSPRLAAMRPFVGVATLRAAGVTILPENFLSEPLNELVTRVLHRVRFLGEQRPFDIVTLSYILPLIFLVLDKGGIECAQDEAADEQIILAVEFLSFHTESCSETSLPRQRLLRTCIAAMERFTQHFRAFRDCFTDLCRYTGPNMTQQETDTVVKGAIVPDPSVRGAVLQAISAELELTDRAFYEEIWLARHDDVQENIEVANEIWEENELNITQDSSLLCLPYLGSRDVQLRRAAARALTSSVRQHPAMFDTVMSKLQEDYVELAQPRKPELDRYGMPIKMDLSDPWEHRHGIALAFKELAAVFPPDSLLTFMAFLIESGPLRDINPSVRDSMLSAATSVVRAQGHAEVEALMKVCETTLAESASSSQSQDLVNEAVVIIYGALAQHLPPGDARVPKVVQRLLETLSTPSESVQFAVAQCLPPLVSASSEQATQYLQQMIDQTLHAKKYAARRGAAYGLAAVVKGKGISILKDSRVLSTLRAATENKKDPNERQGAFLAYELLSSLLAQVFEPYVIQIVPQLLIGFGDSSADVREACLDAAKTCFSSLSSYGVQQVLPTLLDGLREQQWRSKKGASDSLGAMAYLDPQQLAVSLPEIIPPLTEVLNDSHKEVRASANRSLQRFGEVITNPEVKGQVNILLKALSDPTKFTDDALDALTRINFIHYLDAPSLALVVRILERGLGDRSATKRKAAQIIGNLAHLTERKDLMVHLPPLVAGLRTAIVDPVPATRATASKALGSTIEKLGEDALPDLIPSLMQTIKADTGAGDRLGSAQALSEVLAGLGTTRLDETLPTILENVASANASVREGFMSLFIFLPACFGQSFANYLARIIPPILAGLADDIEAIRETALRAGRLLVKNFASKSVDLLLPELQRGLADDSYRIRLSSVELVGDLLFNLTGISGKSEQDDIEENANEAGQSLLEVLGEDKRNQILAALYICRCDTSGLVRTAAINVWKALVSTPRALRELIPTLTQLLIRRLASSNMEQKVIAGNALGELIRKAGEGVLATLLPTLREGIKTSTDTDARQGICIALRELITSASSDSLEEYEETLLDIVRIALADPDEDVREAAAEAFDSLQRILGKRAVDSVLPDLLNLLRDEEQAENALSALLTLLTESTRSNIILPTLLPGLLKSPISAFNARALASLADVAGSAMTRRLPNILNSLMDNIVTCKDDERRAELNAAFDTILLSVDEFDGLNTMMSVMLALVKNDDHRKRACADLHLAKFFQGTDVDYSRYYPDLIRALLIAFDDGDSDVVKAAWTALSALTSRLRKEEMESLAGSTRQTLNQVGVAGHDLPGFSLPKGINAILPIFLQALMNGSAEQRTQAALAISDIVDRTNPDGLRLFVTQITGPLIRVVSERSIDLKLAVMSTLINLLEKISAFLKPFLPQLQRTFAKVLADPSSEILRSRAAKGLGMLISMTPRIDPLIAELTAGAAKTNDVGVKNAMLKALYEVVSRAGTGMNDDSQKKLLEIFEDSSNNDDALNITSAKLFAAFVKVMPKDKTSALVKQRALTHHHTNQSVLTLNALLLEAPDALTASYDINTRSVISQGVGSSQPFVADNCVLAAGKYLLISSGNKSFEAVGTVIEALARVIPPGGSVDTRRLALVVIRTVSREKYDLIQPHLETLVPPIFASVRDTVIPVKLAAEAAFLAIFCVVEEESAIFDKYMAEEGARLQPGPKRSMQEYFKRIALRLSNQAKERKEAEGGQGGLGLSSDEKEDEREVWSVGRVDLGEGGFSDD